MEKRTTSLRRNKWISLEWFLNASIPTSEENAVLLPWLFTPSAATNAQLRRVVELTAKLKGLESLYRDEKSYDPALSKRTDSRWLTDKSSLAATTLEAEATAILSRYKLRQVVSGATLQNPVLEVLLRPACGTRKGFKMTEADAVGMILDMTMHGELKLLKRCDECHRWFIASRGDRQFCTEPCKRRHQQSSPEFREKRKTINRRAYDKAMGGYSNSLLDQRKNPKRRSQLSRSKSTEVR